MNAIDVLCNPEKYGERISIKKIVADRKVYRKGVERYKKMLKEGKGLGTIIVVKHPTKDLYAVLDGHHRFWAQKEMGCKIIKCAVIQDFFGMIFHLTKEGAFQPSPDFTRYIRVPLLKWGEKMLQYLNEFKNNPLKFFEQKILMMPTKKDLCDDNLK